MTMGRTTVLSLAALVCLTLLAVPVWAVPLDGHSLAYEGTWTGSANYSANGGDFTGDVEWAVFGPGVLPPEFSGLSGWTYNSADFTYAYQVKNQGSDSLASFVVDLFNPGGNGGAVDLGDAGSGNDIEPDAISWLVNPYFGYITYDFDAGVGQNQDTTGLVFQSHNIPMYYQGLVVNGGSAKNVRLPSSSAVPIPEPSTLLMLVCGLGIIFLARR